MRCGSAWRKACPGSCARSRHTRTTCYGCPGHGPSAVFVVDDDGRVGTADQRIDRLVGPIHAFQLDGFYGGRLFLFVCSGLATSCQAKSTWAGIGPLTNAYHRGRHDQDFLGLSENLSNSLSGLCKTSGQTFSYLAMDVFRNHIEHERTLTAQIELVVGEPIKVNSLPMTRLRQCVRAAGVGGRWSLYRQLAMS